MPHAETNGSMTVNGDKSQSQFLSHLTSLPVVSDSIETFKSNPYGSKSIELADGAYSRFGKPIEPYLKTPYSYAAPYIAKADSLADKGLGSVEAHFPIVKEDTQTLYETAVGYVNWPLQLAGQGKEYLQGTFSDEYNKTVKRNDRGPGLGSLLMAVVSTELKVASDAFQVAADYLGPKKDEAKAKGGDLLDQAKSTTDKYASQAKGTADQYASKAKDKKDQAATKAQEKSSS